MKSKLLLETKSFNSSVPQSSLVSLMGCEVSRLQATLLSGVPDQSQFRLDSLLGQSTAELLRILQKEFDIVRCSSCQR